MALTRVKEALSTPSIKFAIDLQVFLNNLEVVIRLLSPSISSSQSIFTEFYEVARKQPLRARLLYTRPGAIWIRQVLGHLKIPGNKAADKAAKEGASLALPEKEIYTLASLKRIIKADAKGALLQLQNIVTPANYRDIGIGYSFNLHLLLLLRPIISQILAS